MGDCGVFFQTADCGMADKYGFKAGKKLWKEVLVDSFLFNWKINNIETVLDTWIGQTELQYTLMDDSKQELGFH